MVMQDKRIYYWDNSDYKHRKEAESTNTFLIESFFDEGLYEEINLNSALIS